MKRPADPQSYLAKAVKALAAGAALESSGDVEGTCNRAYYAMYNAAHALLLTTGIENSADPIKSHHGLMMKVMELVDRGQLDTASHKSINEVRFLRQLADYSVEEITPADAAAAMAKATAFVDLVGKATAA